MPNGNISCWLGWLIGVLIVCTYSLLSKRSLILMILESLCRSTTALLCHSSMTSCASGPTTLPERTHPRSASLQTASLWTLQRVGLGESKVKQNPFTEAYIIWSRRPYISYWKSIFKTRLGGTKRPPPFSRSKTFGNKILDPFRPILGGSKLKGLL